MDLYEAIKKRYSCRKYESKAIESEKLDRILEAPEGGFVECDPIEMASFMQLIFFVPQMTEIAKELRTGNPMGKKPKP